MKISVTSIEDLGLDKVFVGGGTCSHCFQFGVFSEYMLHFELTMSNDDTIKVSTDGVIQTDDTDVERALDNLSVNVLKFSHDIKSIVFPDVMFFKTKKAYREFVDSNPDAKITPLYVGGRADGSNKRHGALKRFLREVIKAYAIDENSYYKGELDRYIKDLPSHLI